MKAYIYSKIELDNETKALVEKYVKDKYQINEFQYEIDKEIISGIRIRIGGKVIDLTSNLILENILS
ncbi:MAG: F0F1 ATP synthase subunit delta [Candidatus Dojkabacteria bacterium]|nr:F0F1 ATP synthase subunit delta [Candidatus Dojkabacteria bacterium]